MKKIYPKQSRKIAITGGKGGTGKSTVAVLLANDYAKQGKKVVLVDSAKEVAQEVKSILTELGKQQVSKKKAQYKFLISDRPQAFKKLAKNFLGRDIKNITKV